MADGTIAKAYVQVMPSMQGIQGSLTKAFGGEGTAAGKSFGSSLIGKVKALLVTAGIGKELGESIKAGGALEQSIGGIETMSKDSAAAVIENANQAYQTAGLSANAYMEQVTSFSASLLQSLGGDTAKAADTADMALRDMSDNANKFGTDMTRITDAYQGFAKQNYTMLDNLKLGYGGTKTEMQRLLADAQKLTGVKYDINNLNDVYQAIHAIQEKMGVTGTTAKEASETLVGSFNAMKAAAQNVLGKLALGEAIGPSLSALQETVFTFVTGNLLPMAGNVLTRLPEVLSSAFSTAIRGLNLVADNADTILTMGIDLLAGIGTAIISAVPYLAEAAWNIVTALGNFLITADWASIGSSMLEGLRQNLSLAAGEILGTDGSIVEAVLLAIQTNLPNVLTAGVGIVTNAANGMLSSLPELLTAAGELMAQLLNTILAMLPGILSSGVQLVLNLAAGLINTIPEIVSAATQILADLMATIASHLPDLLAAGVELILKLAAGLLQSLPAVISNSMQIIQNIRNKFQSINWGQVGSNIVSGIARGISSGAGAIISAARSAASAALSAAKSFLGIASPSKVMRDQIGKFIPAGIAVGIEANTRPITEAMDSLSGKTVEAFQLDWNPHGGTPVATAGENRPGNGPFIIHVYGAQGQDVEELAEVMMQKIQFAISRREVCFT